jgi:hypothetical protein
VRLPQELRDDLATRPDLEQRWFDIAALYCPHCRTDGWPTNDQNGQLWHLTPNVICTAAHIWYLRSDTKTSEQLKLAAPPSGDRAPTEEK